METLSFRKHFEIGPGQRHRRAIEHDVQPRIHQSRQLLAVLFGHAGRLQSLRRIDPEIVRDIEVVYHERARDPGLDDADVEIAERRRVRLRDDWRGAGEEEDCQPDDAHYCS